ncbi:MAG: HDOD domain-containing protein [Pseudomonadota bacterium]|nr:HDOD domain-containing protein [Pseudomonadota bacterium]
MTPLLADTSRDAIRLDVRKLSSLPAVSPVLDQLLDAIGDEEITIESFARLIEQDPALLGRIIGLANAAYFGHAEPVTSAEEAIFKSLGLRLARSLALSIALAGPFRILASIPGFELQRFWLQAILTASMTQELSTLVTVEPRPGAEESYLAGMLHNFGLLPLIHLYPEQVTEAYRRREAEPALSLSSALREVSDTDHYEVGAWLAEHWHIPGNIVTVIRNLNDYSYRGDHYPLVLLIHATAEWAESYCNDGDRKWLPESAKAAFFDLGVSVEQVHQVQDKLHRKRELYEAVAKMLAVV